MPWWQKVWIRITHFEFWPFHFFYFPIFFYYGYLVLRHRSFFFFTASNPKIETGGMLGESKWSVFSQIPDQYLPVTRYFSEKTSPSSIEAFLKEKELTFPIVCKPDIGERGYGVEKIKNSEELQLYIEHSKVPFLVQEYSDYPVELGVFFIKEPEAELGRITSIVRKGLLTVTGDGIRTVAELLSTNPRAMLQFDFQSFYYLEALRTVPTKGEKVIVEDVGNHRRGTIFFDDTHKITPELNARFNKIVDDIPDFYFGRFDLRTRSYEDLENGQNFAILELNGAGSEPGHIYAPGFPIFKAYKDIIYHLDMLGKVSEQNHKSGVPYMTVHQGIKKIREVRAYHRLAYK